LASDLATEFNNISMWPAYIFSIVLAAATLPFARLADMYGGGYVFVLGMIWLTGWTLGCGFMRSEGMLCLARAMQGLAVAAVQPASFTLIGTMYPPGKQRNIMLGIYGSQSPLGFFSGILSATLTVRYASWRWYFWGAAPFCLLACVAALVTIPKRCYKSDPRLSMDWIGSLTSCAGLVMVVYSLSAVASASNVWKHPSIYLPFFGGASFIVAFVFVERRWAKCPLIPRSFFKAKSVTPFMIACLFFYGSFGDFLFYSAY
jgi:MFS family permease